MVQPLRCGRRSRHGFIGTRSDVLPNESGGLAEERASPSRSLRFLGAVFDGGGRCEYGSPQFEPGG